MSSTLPREPIPFGHYELLSRIGAGGMGEVFLARLPGPAGPRICVVKKMLQHLSSDRSFVDRFLDEGKVVVQLDHPNIAHVFEVGEVDGEFFFAGEYIEGKTISRVSKRLREQNRRFPIPLALYIAIRVCEGLAYAHRRSDAEGRPLHVVHRDISPANVMVSYSGEVKVIDFGNAQSAIKEAKTAPRVVIGNLAYMSPEQARKRPVDGRADVFSLCVVLWELLSWQAIGQGGDQVERWRRAAYPQFSSPSKFQPDVPPELDHVVMRGLSSDPRDRPQSAEELRAELQAALDRIAPRTSRATLATLVSELFAAEAAEDRSRVIEAMQIPEVTDPGQGPLVHEAATDPGLAAKAPRLGDDSPPSLSTEPAHSRRKQTPPRPPEPLEPPEASSAPTLVAPPDAAGAPPPAPADEADARLDSKSTLDERTPLGALFGSRDPSLQTLDDQNPLRLGAHRLDEQRPAGRTLSRARPSIEGPRLGGPNNELSGPTTASFSRGRTRPTAVKVVLFLAAVLAGIALAAMLFR